MHLQTHLMTNSDQEPVLPEYVVDRPGKIIFVGHHLSTSAQTRCIIRTMSQSGATLDVGTGYDIPTHFFLEIIGIHDEIGCTLIKREGAEVTVGFNMLINAEFLHHVLRLNFEASH
ncbi:hypothetical protein [Rhizobium sp. HT1-10]|uniref:hypothetical protein n=1 Tax=Rhizobium sp. HT1-10 TaxID=3111638 RepID=UPI003C21D843